MTILDDLDRRIEETFQKVLRATDPQNQILDRSVEDLDLGGQSVIRPEITKLEVLQGWRELMKATKKYQVFLDYTNLLSTAFQALDETHSSAFRHCRCLLGLLKHTVDNHHEDDSSECRFVTLVEIMASYGPRWQPSEKVEAIWVRLMQRIPAQVPPINFRRKAYRVLVSLSWVPSSKGLLAACSFEEKRSYDASQTIAAVRGHFEKIRRKELPLPRHDTVNQILDRLKDETDVCVGITSELDGVVCGVD